MPEMICGLIGLAAAILMLAVIGHGIWLVLVAIVRAARGGPLESPSELTANNLSEDQQLRVAAAMLQELVETGEITREVGAESLTGIVKRYQRKNIPPPSWLSARMNALKTVPAAPILNRTDLSQRTAPQSAPPPAQTPKQVPTPFSAPPIEIIDAEIVTAPTVAPQTPQPLAPWDQPDPPVRAPAPIIVAPRKSFADILQSFMEESNIRWGEIIAGLCIVGSAIGLVVSLRDALKSVPYFPAILFLVFTLAFHGAALYTLRRWKLQVVSRVALLIALLLVPLNFAAGVVLGSEQEHMRPLSDPLVLIATAVGAFAGGWICISGATSIFTQRGWIAGACILVCSICEVVVRRFAANSTGLPSTLLLGLVPLAAFVIGLASIVSPMRARKRFGPAHANQIFSVTGLLIFAMLVPLAILLVDSPEKRERLAELTPLLTTATALALGAALLVERRTQRAEFATIRIIATSIATLCVAILLGLLVVAWPRPVILAILCGVLAISFAISAWSLRIAPLALASVIAATLCWTMLVHLFTSPLQWKPTDHGRELVYALSSARTAWFLLPAALAAIGATLTRWIKDAETKRMVQWGGAGVVAASALVALVSGFLPLEAFAKDRSLASPLLLLYGAVLLGAAPKVGARFMTPLGCALLWAGLVHATWQNEVVQERLKYLGVMPDHPVHISTLICSVLFALLGGVAALVCLGLTPIQLGGKARRNLRDVFSEPLAWCALITAIAAAPNALWPDLGDLTWNAKAAAALTISTIGIFVALRKPWIVSTVQACLALTLAYAVAWWKVASPDVAKSWIAPEHLVAQLVTIAAGVLLWSFARRAIARSFLFKEFAESPWSQADRGLHVVGLSACIFLVAIRLLGGIAAEVATSSLSTDIDLFPPWRLCEPKFAAIWVAAAAMAGIVAYLQKPQWNRFALVAIALYLAVPLGAIYFDADHAAASAFRWLSTGLGAVLTAIVLTSNHWSPHLPRWIAPKAIPAAGAEYLPLWLSAAPVLLLTSLTVLFELSGTAPGGPIADTFFARLGPLISHGAPLFTISALFLAYALAKKQPALAAGASAIFQFGVNLAFLLYAKDNLQVRGAVLGIDALIWNALAAGGFGLLWTAFFNRTGSDSLWGKRLHLVQITLAARLGAGISAVLAGWITVRIHPHPITLETGGHWLAYLAVAIGVAPLVWRLLAIRAARWGRLTLAGLGILAPLIAFSIGAANLNEYWLAHRALEVGFGVCLLAASAIACLRPAEQEFARRDRNWIGYGALFLATWLLVLAIGAKGVGTDPMFGWQEGCCAVAALGCIVCGLVLAWELHALASILAALFAATLSLLELSRGLRAPGWEFIDLAFVPLRGISAALFVSLIWQARAIWEDRSAYMQGQRPPHRWVHHVAGLVALPLICFFSAAIFLFGLGTNSQPERWSQTLFHIAGLVIPCGFFFSAMWDRKAFYSLAALFTLGLCLLLPIVSLLPARNADLPPYLAVAAAVYIAICGQLFAYGANLAAWGKKSGIPMVVDGLNRLQFWLPGALVVLTAVCCSMAAFKVLTADPLEMRTIFALTPFATAWGIANLASTDRRAYARSTALLLAVGGAILLSWSQIEPVHNADTTLDRSFRLLVVLCVATLVLGLILPRWIIRAGAWFDAARLCAAVTACSSFAALALTLAMEVVHFRSGLTSPSDLHVIVVAVALVGLIAGLLSMALSKTLGRADWTQEQRMGFVYAAQVTGGLLFAHVYFCRPTWFDGVLLPYWPYILMGVAFASAGIGEIFKRSKIRVLSEPFQNSGLFLPLLPMLGIWLHPGSTDRALVLLIGALLYLTTSLSNKSWATLGAAIVAANASLWTLFTDRGLNFIHHPQMWLIPPAVCVLIAAHLQRKRLDANVLATIRYAAMIVIYVSSTSEIFLRGMGKEFWPPLILLALSVTGAMLGIALRVRAFLFLGFAFTLISLTCMVWYAATGLSHVWPWWAFGIGVGIAILMLFGYFEKNRAQVQTLIERLRAWEA